MRGTWGSHGNAQEAFGGVGGGDLRKGLKGNLEVLEVPEWGRGGIQRTRGRPMGARGALGWPWGVPGALCGPWRHPPQHRDSVGETEGGLNL